MKEQTIECSGLIILECHCGERVVLLGHEDDWYSEERLVFTCECGEQLTLADRVADRWPLGKSSL